MMSECERRRTPEEWLKEPEFAGTHILDQDGWRRNDGRTWEDKISKDEFVRRMMESTCRLPAKPVQ